MKVLNLFVNQVYSLPYYAIWNSVDNKIKLIAIGIFASLKYTETRQSHTIKFLFISVAYLALEAMQSPFILIRALAIGIHIYAIVKLRHYFIPFNTKFNHDYLIVNFISNEKIVKC